MIDEERLESLQRQLANQEDNLLLIEEQMSKFVLETDIPLQLKREHTDKVKTIEWIRAQIEFLIELSAVTMEYSHDNQVTDTDITNLYESDNDLSEARRFSQSLREYFTEFHKDIEYLTQDQYRVIQQLRFVKRVRISGCAGSGKTLVAAEKAVRMANVGLSVLFLCHNPLLYSNHIENGSFDLPGSGQKMSALAVISWPLPGRCVATNCWFQTNLSIAEYVRRLTAGARLKVLDFCKWIQELTITSDSQPELEWTHFDEPDHKSLALASDKLVVSGERYDVVVIDEGQDFRKEWWSVVEASLRHSTESWFYIFHDNNQSLLPNRSEYPISKPEFDLSRNCRNLGRVYELIRCFDLSSPEPEIRLKARGDVKLVNIDSEPEIPALTQIITQLSKQGVIRNTVLLLGTSSSLSSSPFAGLKIPVQIAGPWQNEVQKQFDGILYAYKGYGVGFPEGGSHWVSDELNKLSSSPFPTESDIQLVSLVAKRFSIQENVRRKIMRSPRFRHAIRWIVRDSEVELRRSAPGSFWAAEMLLYFQKTEWWKGIPESKTISILPYSTPLEADTISMYKIADFKGLEADIVILYLRGGMMKHREMLYVGVSRARYMLYVMTDDSAFALFPKGFVWHS